jgi:hypothetical protein
MHYFLDAPPSLGMGYQPHIVLFENYDSLSAMKTKSVTIPVAANRIAQMTDPQRKGHDTIHAYVKIADLPLDLPSDVNPRAQNTESRVARQISQGLVDDSDIFHLLNRGMTITAYNAKYNAKTEQLTLELAGGYYGVLDGGHTYAVIKKNLTPYLESQHSNEEKTEKAEKTKTKDVEVERPEFLDAFVRVEVIVGVKTDLLVDIARSRNTSAQVKDESLANLEGSFDWLKEQLFKTRFGEQIAYKENEDDAQFPIDVREIVSLLTLFHPKFQDSENPPIMGYTSKGRCLELFREDEEGYKALRPIIPSILEMYDYIHLKFADIYKSIGGFGGIGDEDKRKKDQKGVKLAKVTGVKHLEEGFPLYYIGETAHFRFPDGWLLPCLAAMRGLCSYKTVIRWKADPKAFFDKVGRSLVKMTLESSVALGRNPNAVGKSRPHWMQLHEKVQNAYMKALNVDTEQDVKV